MNLVVWPLSGQRNLAQFGASAALVRPAHRCGRTTCSRGPAAARRLLRARWRQLCAAQLGSRCRQRRKPLCQARATGGVQLLCRPTAQRAAIALNTCPPWSQESRPRPRRRRRRLRRRGGRGAGHPAESAAAFCSAGRGGLANPFVPRRPCRPCRPCRPTLAPAARWPTLVAPPAAAPVPATPAPKRRRRGKRRQRSSGRPTRSERRGNEAEGEGEGARK